MKKSAITTLLAAAVLVLGLLAACSPSSSSESGSTYDSTSGASSGSDAGLVAQAPPGNGEILFGADQERYSQITVHASDNQSSFVKLKDPSGYDIMGFYVRAGQTATVDVPATSAKLYFASGDTWYGQENLFGSSTICMKDNEVLDLYNYTYEFTLYTVSNGNMNTSKVPPSEF